MVLRFRTRTHHSAIPGFYTIRTATGSPIFTSTGASGVSDRSECTDHTIPPPYNTDNPLHMERRTMKPLKLYGKVPYSFFGTNYTDYQGWNPTNRSLYQYTPNCSSFDMQYFVTKALANLNPNAPAVDLPLFFFEFKDFPRMLRNLGDILARRRKPTLPGESYLAYSYGWEPLFRDSMTLFALAKGIQDRMAYLARMESGTRVRRSLGKGTVLNAVAVGGGTYGDDFRGTLITADVTTSETYKAWFTANGRLLDPLPPSSEARFDLAVKLLLGLDLSRTRPTSASTLWNALPWSFLIDYFANIGDYLQAYRGVIRYDVSRMCVMVRQESESFLTNVKLYPGCSYTGGNAKTVVKWRGVYAYPVPIVTADPFLSARQALNIGALISVPGLRKLRG